MISTEGWPRYPRPHEVGPPPPPVSYAWLLSSYAMLARLSPEEWEALLDLPSEEAIARARAYIRGTPTYDFPEWPPVRR